MKSPLLKSLILTLLYAGFFLFLTTHLANAQTDDLRQSLFKDADAALKAAEDKEASIYAPATFAAGMDSYKKAEDDLKKGREIKEIQKKLASARDFFGKAAEQAKRCTSYFGPVVKARNEAAHAEAQRYTPEIWKRAEARLVDAIKALESGEDSNARSKGVEAEALYREAELEAVKTGCLGEARSLLKKAEQMDVKKNAPITFERSYDLLKKAEKTLDENRHDISNAQGLANEALYEANHAIYLAQSIKRLTSEKKTLEEILMEAEKPIKTIANALAKPVRFDQGMEPPTQELAATIRNMMKQ